LRFLAVSASPAGKSADKAQAPCGGTRIIPMDSPWLGPKDFLELSKMFGDLPVDVLPWGYLSTSPEGGEARLSGAVPSREPWVIHFIGTQTEEGSDVHELALSLEGLGHHFDGEIPFQARTGETRGVRFGLPSRGQLIVLVTPRRCGTLVPELARQRRFFAKQVELTPPVGAEQTLPTYPVMARVRNVDGPVVMRLLIDEKGQTSDPLVLSAPHNEPNLIKAAVEAARSWRYRPARENGVPVPVFQTIMMPFRQEPSGGPPPAGPKKSLDVRTTPTAPPP
jgi:TonB family protein